MNAIDQALSDYEELAPATARAGAEPGRGGGYENSPACRMLATNCAACGRPLVDANSVEAGMGPDCREKYGHGDAVEPAARAEANQLVYQVALARSERRLGLDVAQAAVRIGELGLPRLSAKILEAACSVSVAVEGNLLVVETPYSAPAVAAFRRIHGRRWDRERKVNTFPVSARPAVWSALRALFPGELGTGPKGVFQL